MTLLVFGESGQLARELGRAGGVTCLSRAQADLTDPEACAAMIRAHAPAGVINAAAFTDVDGAESEEALATRINGAAPGAMARTCAGLGIPFVTISTDYVFDGSGNAPWKPADRPAPLNAYGRSKLAGERLVLDAGGAAVVLRCSWVVSAHGRNFVRTMLRLGRERDHLAVVADQIGGPTPARALAGACLVIAQTLRDQPGLRGIHHFSGAPDISWAGFARAIFEQAGLAVRVEDIPTSDYPAPAPRPLNSRLDCGATLAAFGLARPDWRAGLRDIIDELEAAT